MTGLLSRDGSTVPVVIAGLLGFYLVTLVGFAYLGQQQLLQSMLEREQLNADKLASSLGYLIAHRQLLVNELATSQEIQNYLASPKPGLTNPRDAHQPSLDLSDRFEQLLARSMPLHGPGFRSITMTEPDGHVLLRINEAKSSGITTTYAIQDPKTYGTVLVRREPSGNLLLFSAAVDVNGDLGAVILAEVDAQQIWGRFLGEDGKAETHRHTAIIGADDRVVIANEPFDWHNWRQSHHASKNMFVEAPVVGTGMRVVKIPDVAIDHPFLASPLLIIVFVLSVLPLIAGMAYLWRLNRHKLALDRRAQAATQQHAVLRSQNRHLQREINKRIESEQKLARQTSFDSLTGLPNRTLALDRLAQAIKWAKREKGGVLVLLLDLDRFKQVNDSLGHNAGDELLREAAQRLQSYVRESDTVSRLGSDEFLIICPELPCSIGWEACARGLLTLLSGPFYVRDHEFVLSASIGVSAYPDGGSDPHRLLRNADIAMYAAKEQGRNRYRIYEPSMDAAALEGIKLEHHLRHALARGELSLQFQPIVDLTSSRMVATEALLRWHNAELGQVSPERFIPVAEETGLIHDIGKWVLHEACHVISSMPLDTDFRVAVNLSSKQLSQPKQLLNTVLDALRQSGLMPNQLELEITETTLIDNRPETAELINQLDRLGVRLSVDDFGTGYSALNYLQRFPFNVLKIDRSFINQVPNNQASASLIRAIIAMAHALDLEVIAEGIERREQTGFLLVNHCELGQGFLYSKPLGPAQLQHLISEDSALSA